MAPEETRQLLKKDLFGAVWRVCANGEVHILRDTRSARRWVAAVARWLLRREACALAALSDVDGVPELLSVDDEQLSRSYLSGKPLNIGQPDSDDFFHDAMRLLRRLHNANVAHNDLAKEPNILVLDDGSPAFIDFQLASYSPGRGRLFRAAAREDIRHLLKHKRTYRPEQLTKREQGILESPSPVSRLYMMTIKPVYLFVTRRLFGWADREGATDRGSFN
jgi:RIO-like serine/threonine protein kinase